MSCKVARLGASTPLAADNAPPPEARRNGDPTTMSGIPIKSLYTLDDIGLEALQQLGLPGEFPYLRGMHKDMYRGRIWTMRQFAGMGNARHTNERFKYLLEHGQTGLSTAFDLPTLMGRDSDDALSLGEVGKCGVAISSLEDMKVLFDGINLGEVSTSMTINAPAAILLAFYICVARSQGVALDRLRGTLQNDILKEFHAQNEFVFPPAPSVKLVIDTIEYCTQHLPQWNTVSISGYHIREAGATAPQELAFTIADGMCYAEESIKRGLDVDAFAPRLSYFWDVHNEFFEEIAKIRAARRLWATIMRDRFGAKNARSLWCRCHCQTAGVSLTEQQPMVNIIRVAYQALAAVLGGTQSLHTNSMDETLALPTENAVKIALRTQQIIAEETGVTRTVDPLGGSFFIESLTNEVQAAPRPSSTRFTTASAASCRDRGRLLPPCDRRLVRSLRCRIRSWRASHDRRQQVRREGLRAHPGAKDRRRGRTRTGRAAEGVEGPPRRRPGQPRTPRQGAGGTARGRGLRCKRNAGVDRGVRGLGDGRRDDAHPGRRLRPLRRRPGAVTSR
jgi:methylmalonyl-CoA mutase cobalamin-binding domain/chain